MRQTPSSPSRISLLKMLFLNLNRLSLWPLIVVMIEGIKWKTQSFLAKCLSLNLPTSSLDRCFEDVLDLEASINY